MKKQLEEPPIHESITIDLLMTPDQIDDRGHVNNAIYLTWVQQAAALHWNRMAGDHANSYAWVVRRHEIDYLAPARPGAEIMAITWVGETDARSSIRHVRIQTRQGQVLANVRTIWCLTDPQSGRFRRISEEVRQLLGK
jgi:acyl-CoA thioester hydrolase